MTDANTTETPARKGGGTSREVSFLAVYQLLSPLLGDPGIIPGTPVWTQLDNTDPAKWQAVLWSAVWWAVAEDARQEAVAAAGEAISEAADWTEAARQLPRRREIDELRRSA